MNHFKWKEILINSLNKAAEYKFWHQRLVHLGNTCMDAIHNCVDGILKLKRHDFHSCLICQEAKIQHQYNKNLDNSKTHRVGEIFSVDF